MGNLEGLTRQSLSKRLKATSGIQAQIQRKAVCSRKEGEVAVPGPEVGAANTKANRSQIWEVERWRGFQEARRGLAHAGPFGLAVRF